MGFSYFLGGILGFNLVLFLLIILACILAYRFRTLSWILLIVGMGLEIWSFVGNYKRNEALGFSNDNLTMYFAIGMVAAVIGVFIITRRSLGSSKKYVKGLAKETALKEKQAGELVTEKVLTMQDDGKNINERVEALYWLWDQSTFPVTDKARDNFLQALTQLNDENGKTMNKSSLRKMLVYYCSEFDQNEFNDDSRELDYLKKIKADLNIK